MPRKRHRHKAGKNSSFMLYLFALLSFLVLCFIGSQMANETIRGNEKEERFTHAEIGRKAQVKDDEILLAQVAKKPRPRRARTRKAENKAIQSQRNEEEQAVDRLVRYRASLGLDTPPDLVEAEKGRVRRVNARYRRNMREARKILGK